MTVNRSHEALPKAHSVSPRTAKLTCQRDFRRKRLGRNTQDVRREASRQWYDLECKHRASIACDPAGSDGNLVVQEELALQKL